MKFLVFATGALATITARQVSVVSDAIASISSGTSALGTAVTNFGGISDVASLTTASQSLLSTINSATESINGIATLSSNDALTLAQPITDLNTVVGSAIDAVIAKKSAFVGLSVGSTVYDQLTQLQTAASGFSSATLSKIPSSLSSIAQGLAQPILDNIARGVAAYADQQGAGSSSSAGASSTTSAPGSSSSAAVTTTSGATSAPTTSGAATTTSHASSTTSKAPIATYTGAAAANAAGFGAVAVAALAAVAAF